MPGIINSLAALKGLVIVDSLTDAIQSIEAINTYSDSPIEKSCPSTGTPGKHRRTRELTCQLMANPKEDGPNSPDEILHDKDKARETYRRGGRSPTTGGKENVRMCGDDGNRSLSVWVGLPGMICK